jgi:hypothetical protein
MKTSWFGFRKLMRFRGELIVAFASGIVGFLSGEVLKRIVIADVTDQIIVILLSSLLVFSVLSAIKIKRDITGKLNYLHGHLVGVFGPELWNQYTDRGTHFAEEKQILANQLVEKYLPLAISEACEAYKVAAQTDPSGVVIIIDSGTTLAPIFPIIKKHGFSKEIGIEPENIEIYTNSLSGVDEFNKANVQPQFPVDNLFLIGGRPLASYRATTGSTTIEELDRLSQNCLSSSKVIVAVLTANWITTTPGYEELHLCAKGPGHLEFKDKVQSISHKVVVVSPLGKILRDREAHTINKIMTSLSLEKYKSIELVSEDVEIGSETPMRKEVVLLTTFRRNAGSFLYEHSKELYDTHNNSGAKVAPSYRLADKEPKPRYTPRGSREDQRQIEMPHDYIWPESGPLLAAFDK